MLPASYQMPAAVVLLIGGIVACFFGYRLFRVVLSLTGARTLSNSTVTVTARDATSGATLAGQVRINGVAAPIGQAVTFPACTETMETYQDARGVTRTRTVRVPCEGVVQVPGYADTYFNF